MNTILKHKCVSRHHGNSPSKEEWTNTNLFGKTQRDHKTHHNNITTMRGEWTKRRTEENSFLNVFP